MRELGFPVLLLLALIGAMVVFLVPMTRKEPFEKKPLTRSLTFDEQKLVEKAERDIDTGKGDEAEKVLSPLKKTGDLKVQILLAAIQAGKGALPKTEVDTLEKLVAKDRGVELVYLLAKLYGKIGETKKASGLFGELLKNKLPPGYRPKILLFLGTEALNTEQGQTAAKYFAEAAADMPMDQAAFLKLLTLLAQKGLKDELESMRKAGDRQFPKNYEYSWTLGKAYFDMGAYEKAEERFRSCAQIQDSNPLPHFFLYQIHRKAKKTTESLQELDKVLASPSPLPPEVSLPEACFASAIDAKRGQRLDLAFRLLRKALLADRAFLGKTDEGTLEAVRRHLQEKGTEEERTFFRIFEEFINGETNKAEKEMSESLNGFRNQALKSDAARLMEECQKIREKEKAYEEFVRKSKEKDHGKLASQSAATTPKPSLPPAVSSGAQNMSGQGTPPGGNNPADAQSLYIAGLKMFRSGDPEGAKILFNKVIVLDPRRSQALSALAEVHKSQGNKQEAISCLDQALAIQPNDSKARSALALLIFETGDLSRATDEAKASLASDPNNGEGHLVLAKVLASTGGTDAALKEIERGLAAENDSTSPTSEALFAYRSELSANPGK